MLREHFEAVVAERLGGDVGIFHVEGERAFALGAFNEAVDVVDVNLGFEERREHILELRFTLDLNDENLALGVRIIVVDEKLAGLVGVVDNHANDGAVGRIENCTRHDVDIVVPEERGQIVEFSHSVFGENGELFNRVAGSRGAGHKFARSAKLTRRNGRVNCTYAPQAFKKEDWLGVCDRRPASAIF